MVRQTASVVIMEILGGLVLVLMAACVLLWLRLSSGPIDLGPFRDDVEQALSDAREGRPVSIGALQLEWSPEEKRVRIRAQDVRLLDAEGQPAAEAERAGLVLSASALLLGKIEVLRLSMEDGWIGLDQVSAAEWRIAGDPLPEFKAREWPVTPQGWLDLANTLLPEWLAALRETDDGLTIESVRFDGFELRVRGPDRARIGSVQHSTGSLTRTADGLSLTLTGSGLGQGMPGGMALRMTTSENGTRMQAELGAANWPMGELFRRVGLGGETAEGLESNFEISVGFTEADGIEDVRLAARSGEGELKFLDSVQPVRDVRFTGNYARADDKLSFVLESVGFGQFKGRAEFDLDNALLGEGFRPFRVRSPALTADLAPLLAAPVDFASIEASGEANLDLLAVRGLTAKVVTGGAAFEINGDLARTPERQPGEMPVIGNLDVRVPGELPLETVIALWPVNLASGARSWGEMNVEAGKARNVVGKVKLQRDSMAEGHLRDTDLEVTFEVEDAHVKFLPDLPAVENGRGKGRLTGNSFRVVADSANYSGWTVTEGMVDFPGFYPRGTEFRVFAKGRGPARNIIRVLADSRLQFDLDPARVSGEADMTYEMFRPALNDVPFEDMRFTAFGKLRNAGLKAAAFGFDLPAALSM